MDFFKTFYNNKNNKNIIQTGFSKTRTNFYNFKNETKIIKNSLFEANYKSSLIDKHKNRTMSHNIITNKMIKTINKIKSEKSCKGRKIRNCLENFHTEVIKLNLRKNDRFNSLFEKTDISSNGDSIFQSIKSNNKMQKRLMNLKLKSNKNKNNFLKNNLNTINYTKKQNIIKYLQKNWENTNGSLSDINSKINNKKNNFINYQKLGDDISKTHFSTIYFSSGGNKSVEKSFSSIFRNKNNIFTSFSNIKKIDKISNNNHNQKTLENRKNNNTITYNNLTINSDSNTNYNLFNNNEKLFSNNRQSFITSLNYIKPPPFQVEFGEQNLLNFNSKTRDLCYGKYFLLLKKNRLKYERETSQVNMSLNNLDIIKLIHFYRLFKPYNEYLEKYLLFLKEEIKINYKENERLKIIKGNILTDVMISRKKLLQIHKKLKGYLNDKYVLLCVKNFTLNLDSFDEKDKYEFENDLKTFEALRNYINELSELDFQELGTSGKKSIINYSKKRTIISSIHLRNRNSKIKNVFIDNNNSNKMENIISIFKNSRMKAKPIFKNIEEFNEYMLKSRDKIENLLLKANKIDIETANLRENFYKCEKDKNEVQNNLTLIDNDNIKLKKELSLVKIENSKLISNKKDLLKKKKMRFNKVITKKLKEVINIIYDQKDKAVNKLIILKNIDKPLLALKDIEKAIIFLLDYKNNKKKNNKKEYYEVAKEVDKQKRLLIIKKRKEEDANKIEKKFNELIEKDNKILNINRRINEKYKPQNWKKEVKKEKDSDDKKNSVDITY